MRTTDDRVIEGKNWKGPQAAPVPAPSPSRSDAGEAK